MTLPAVCFTADVCAALRISRTTFKRLRRHGAFPIPELPSLDKRPRFSGAAVTAFIASSQSPRVRHTRTVTAFVPSRSPKRVGGSL